MASWRSFGRNGYSNICIESRTSQAFGAQVVESSCIMRRVSPNFCRSKFLFSSNCDGAISVDHGKIVILQQSTNVAYIDKSIAYVKGIFLIFDSTVSNDKQTGEKKLQFHDKVQSFSPNLCFDDL